MNPLTPDQVATINQAAADGYTMLVVHGDGTNRATIYSATPYHIAMYEASDDDLPQIYPVRTLDAVHIIRSTIATA